jgi:O-antigen/teichoic acid export membrane protein
MAGRFLLFSNELARTRSDQGRSLADNAAALAAARVLPRLVQIGYIVLLARRLGPELYGLFVYAQSWYLTLLPLTSFGLYVLLARTAGTNRAAMPAAVAHTLAVRLGVATLAALLIALAAQFGESDPQARILLLIFSAALLGRAIVMWTEHVFVAFESSHYALHCELAFRLIESGIGILLLVWGAKVVPCAILHAVVCWSQAAAGLVIVHRRLVRVVVRFSWRKASELLALGWPLSLNVFSSNFLLQGPMVLYRSLAPNQADIGQLAVPLQGLAILGLVPAATATSILPALARLRNAAAGGDQRLVQTMIALAYGFGAVAGLIGLALGPWLVERALGAQYATAGSLLGPALWLVVPYACGSVLTSLALMRGQTRIAVTSSLAAALVLAMTGPALTGWWQQSGMLAATALALSCWVAMFLANGVGDLTACVIRPLGWISLALAAYLVFSFQSPLLALVIGLVTLVGSARQFGITIPRELRERRR